MGFKTTFLRTIKKRSGIFCAVPSGVGFFKPTSKVSQNLLDQPTERGLRNLTYQFKETDITEVFNHTGKYTENVAPWPGWLVAVIAPP